MGRERGLRYATITEVDVVSEGVEGSREDVRGEGGGRGQGGRVML